MFIEVKNKLNCSQNKHLHQLDQKKRLVDYRLYIVEPVINRCPRSL